MTENKKKVNDYIIHRKEISNLLFNMGEGISTHSLSMWLKSKTDDEWVVVPRAFVYISLSFFEEKATTYSKQLPHYKEMMEEFRTIKNYL
jgi:hypothetical protein